MREIANGRCRKLFLPVRFIRFFSYFGIDPLAEMQGAEVSERGDNDLVIAMLVLAILVLAVFLSYHITQTRDLQRRVGQLESERR